MCPVPTVLEGFDEAEQTFWVEGAVVGRDVRIDPMSLELLVSFHSRDGPGVVHRHSDELSVVDEDDAYRGALKRDGSEGCRDLACRGFQLLACWRVAAVDPQAESVIRISGYHVDVGVSDLLAGIGSVGQIEVDPLDALVTSAQRGSSAPGDVHHVSRDLIVEIDEVGTVLAWKHEKVTRCDRIDVHDRHHDVVPVDVVRGEITFQDGAEDTELGGLVGVIGHWEDRTRCPVITRVGGTRRVGRGPQRVG